MAREGVYKLVRKSGDRWRAIIDIGPDPATKKRRQRTKVFDSESAAYQWRVEQLATIRQPGHVDPSEEPLAVFLPRWLESQVSLRASSRKRYQGKIARHIIPALGATPIGALTVEQVEQLQAALVRKGLAPHTVNTILSILSAAMKRAVRWGLIARNPCDLVDGLSEPKRRAVLWTVDEVRTFLAGTTGDELAACWQLAAACGLRRGELLALRWGDVDLGNGWLTVNQTRTEDAAGHIVNGPPKTDDGQRRIGLPSSIVAALKTHRAHQLERRLVAGAAWQDLDLIFDRGDGGYRSLHVYNAHFHRARQRIGLPTIRPHDLRHAASTLMMHEAGIPDGVVSKLLGHANIGITHDIYESISDADRRAAAAAVERVLWGDRAAS